MIGEAAFAEAAIASGESESDEFTWIVMGGASGDTVVYGPAFYTNANGDIIDGYQSEVPALSVEIVARDDLANPIVDALDYTFGRQFLDEYNDVGSGQISYTNTDVDAKNAILPDRLITFSVWGVRAWTMLVESLNRISIDPSEEFGQITTVLGRGHMSVFDESVLYPSRGTGVLPIEEDRTFNWSTPSPVYDDSGWGYAVQICTVELAQIIWPKQPFVEGWPEPKYTGVIWARGSTYLNALTGYCYFRRDFTVPSSSWYLVYAACDNEGELWLDGQQVLTLGGFLSTFSYSVYITAGTHTIAVRGLNYADAFPGHKNPAGLVVAIFSQDANGEPDTLIVKSDWTWKISPYPADPPGMEVGRVLHTVKNEATARAELTDVSLMFTETEDSAGQPWPITVDIATKVGTSFLVFLLELSATYIDIWMEPGTLNFYAWNTGTRPTPNNLTLYSPTDENDPLSGNMLEQAHTKLS